MPQIILATLNARYAHCAFGLRFLLANLGELRDQAAIQEFDLSQRAVDVAERLLEGGPRIIGLGVYVWNATQTAELVAVIKRIAPQVVIVLGGPEVSYEIEAQPIVALADYVITGEADLAFAQLCRRLLAIAGGSHQADHPTDKIIHADPPDLARVVMPYDLYTDQDLVQRIVYVESSRGCPFGCEFCLSSLDVPVRAFEVGKFLQQMQHLLDRGLRQFKFVDRTFNVNVRAAEEILRFFHERYLPGLFLHFEMIPDHFPDSLRGWIEKFPSGALQFEVGIQTFNEQVAQRIGRRQDNQKAQQNLLWLRQRTQVHIHSDLIIGLPGESVESFAAGFDRLVGLNPQEIQVGILKRLRGAPIERHSAEWGMVYSPLPPYEILHNHLIDFAMMQRLRRFARFWDLIANSGNFIQTLPLIYRCTPQEGTEPKAEGSPFQQFLQLSDWLYAQTGHTHGIALQTLAELIFRFLTQQQHHPPAEVARAIWSDYQRVGRNDRPEFLRPYITELERSARREVVAGGRRQGRHLARE